MLKKHSQLFEGFFCATDIVAVSLAWVLSYWLRFVVGFIPIDKGVPPYADYLKMLLFVWLIWGLVFRRMGLYKPTRGVRRFKEVWRVVKANSFCVLLLLAATYLFREKSVPFSRMVFLIFWALSTVFAVISRTAIRVFLRALRRRGYNLRYAIVVGGGALAEKVVRRMKDHPEYGIELVGCLSSQMQPGVRFSPHMRMVDGSALRALPTPDSSALPLVGSYQDLPLFLRRGGIDQVIVALPYEDHEKLGKVISLIGDTMVDVKIVPDVHQFIQLGSEVEEFDGLPVVSLASTPLAGFNRVAKRIFDVIFGLLLFLICFPAMCFIALLVKVTSPGPIFFRQQRVGLDGRLFDIFKFRTMRLDAEAAGAQFAVRGDPRVTALGRFLRRTSLDELPQLLNVIAGQMSLVGPRPERPVFIDEFRTHIPKYMLRHKVQAGMTGWAQVHGWRGNTSIEKRIEHDLFYIENWSLGMDLKILFLTILRGISDRNAY